MNPEYLTADELFEQFPELVTKLQFTKKRLASVFQMNGVVGSVQRGENKIYYHVPSVLDFARYVNRTVMLHKTADIDALEARWRKEVE